MAGRNPPASFDARIRGRLRFRHMALLVALGEHRSLRRAAEQMHLAQPTAGKLLRELESVFDLPLFERTPRGVAPTVYGDILIRRAAAVLADMEGAREEIESAVQGIRGRVRVGVFSASVPHLLVETILRLRELAPELLVTLHEGGSEVLLPSLSHGEIDCALGRLANPARTNDLSSTALYSEALCLVVRNKHLLLRRKTLELKDVAAQEWIFPPQEALLRLGIESVFVAQGLPIPRPAVESASAIMTEALIQRTDLVCAYPESVARHFAARGQLSILPIDFLKSLPAVGLWTRKSARPAPALRKFLDTIRAVAREASAAGR